VPQLFVVIRAHGQGWDESLPLDRQVGWAAHAAFMDRLTTERFVALGGPLEGTDEALLVVRANDAVEISERLAADPWEQNGLLVTKRICQWRIRLGSLS
jgi:uncharacterized protein YciI